MAWRKALALGLLLSQCGEFGLCSKRRRISTGVIDTRPALLLRAHHPLDATTHRLRRRRAAPRANPRGRRGSEGPRPTGRARCGRLGRFGHHVSQMLMAGCISVTLDRPRVKIHRRVSSAQGVLRDGTRLDCCAKRVRATRSSSCSASITSDRARVRRCGHVLPTARIFVRAFAARVMSVGEPVTGFPHCSARPSTWRVRLGAEIGAPRTLARAEELRSRDGEHSPSIAAGTSTPVGDMFTPPRAAASS